MTDIENTIIKTAAGAIFRAIASVRGDPAFLIAHVEFSSEYPESNRETFLRELIPRLPLPKYMCPAIILPIATMPLNNHVKVDRRAIENLPFQVPTGSSQNINSESLSETELDLKAIWKNVISSDIADTVSIQADTDFFHIGGNSLLLVRLQAIIREKFNVAVAIVEMFEASTLRIMAAKIENSSPVIKIDWEMETAVNNALLHVAPSTSNPTSSVSGLTVLLTGSTGYLGRHILQLLVSDNRISRIHCVAVRKDNPKNLPRDVLEASPKITVHEGDLAATKLGLTEPAFTSLSKEVDLIIHSGAERAFTDYYQVLRGTNVQSTKEISLLALPRRVPIHFISSGGVLDIYGSDTNSSPFSIINGTAESSSSNTSSPTPPTNGSNGYVATKWASERYLENATDILEIPVYIHRVMPRLMSQGLTPSKEEDDEVLRHFASICERMKTLPLRQSGWSGTFDVINTTFLAQQIVDSACESSSQRQGAKLKARYLQYPAQHRVETTDLEEYLVRQMESKIMKEEYET